MKKTFFIVMISCSMGAMEIDKVDKSPTLHVRTDEIAIHIHSPTPPILEGQPESSSETVSILKLKYNMQFKVAVITGIGAIATTTCASIGTLITAIYSQS